MKQSNIILYSTPTGHVNIEVVFHNEIRKLQKEATVSILETVQKEGDRNITFSKVNFAQLRTL